MAGKYEDCIKVKAEIKNEIHWSDIAWFIVIEELI